MLMLYMAYYGALSFTYTCYRWVNAIMQPEFRFSIVTQPP